MAFDESFDLAEALRDLAARRGEELKPPGLGQPTLAITGLLEPSEAADPAGFSKRRNLSTSFSQ